MQPRYGTSAPGGSAPPPYVESVPGEHPYVDNAVWRRAVRGDGTGQLAAAAGAAAGAAGAGDDAAGVGETELPLVSRESVR